MSISPLVSALVEAGLRDVPRDAIRATVRTLAASDRFRDISANTFQATLRSLGLGYRRQDLLADIRQAREQAIRSDRIRNVPRTATPTLSVFDEGPDTIEGNFRFVVAVEAVDIMGGLSREYITIETDNLATIEEIEEEAADYFRRGYGSFYADVLGTRVMRGFIRRGLR